MTLHLTFKEKEIRDLCEASFVSQADEMKRRLTDRRIIFIVFVGLMIGFLALIYFHPDWIYYAAIFAALATGSRYRTWRLLKKHNQNMVNDIAAIDDFINRYKTIYGIKYVYDDKVIQYFEQDKLKLEILWENFVSVQRDDDSIVANFRNKEQRIWIPRVTVDAAELLLFENM